MTDLVTHADGRDTSRLLRFGLPKGSSGASGSTAGCASRSVESGGPQTSGAGAADIDRPPAAVARRWPAAHCESISSSRLAGGRFAVPCQG